MATDSMIEIGHASHAGLQRQRNEDSYWADTALGLFLVVDGMGGAGRGELAAALARDAIVAATRHDLDVHETLLRAEASIVKQSAGAAEQRPMGASVGLLRIDGDHYTAAAIGDNPVFLWHGGELCRIAAQADPQVLAGEAAAIRGSFKPEPRPRSRATQMLGITPTQDWQVKSASGSIQRGMQFLLCSDGLSDELDDTQIAAILARQRPSAQECVDQLLLAALDAGGRDNLTALLVNVASLAR